MTHALKAVRLALAAAALLAAPAFADVSVQGSQRPCCSGYWSRTDGLWRITYRNDSLPWGTRVFVKSGLKQEWGTPYRDWAELRTTSAAPVAGWTWQADVERQIAGRGGPTGTALQFVVMIAYPDGSVAYDKGNDSAMGYYEAPVAQCQQEYCAVELRSVRKDF